MKQKKGQPMSIRMPERLKREIEAEAAKNVRSVQDEIVLLLVESVHQRKCNPHEYRIWGCGCMSFRAGCGMTGWIWM